MKIDLLTIKGICIAEIISDSIEINNSQDALDLMANCAYQGATRVIIHDENITPAFFDLKNKLAGDILQKFSNYKVRLAIVGDFSKYPGKSIRDFIFESNKHGHINFVSSVEEAKERLTR